MTPAPAATVTLLNLAAGFATEPSHLGLDAKGTSAAITTTLGIALILTAVALVFRRRLLAKVAPFFERRNDREIAGLTIVLGAVLGVLVSLSSVGGRGDRRNRALDALSKNADGAHRRH